MDDDEGQDHDQARAERRSEAAIRAAVDRETAAWDRQDADALLDLFHPDMVWAWPPTATDHDPATWDLELGRYDRERWRANWETLFATHDLANNERETVRVAVSPGGGGGMAVVDIDTRWRDRETGETFDWRGRTAKLYAEVDPNPHVDPDGADPGPAWLVTAQWGALTFDEDGRPVVDQAE